MAGTKRRAYLTEPQFGPQREFNTSRMTQDKGRTDQPKTSNPSNPDAKQKTRQSLKDSLAELRQMGTKSKEFEARAQQAKQDVQERSKRNRVERSQSGPRAGREDAMNRYMEERKRRNDGQSKVIG